MKNLIRVKRQFSELETSLEQGQKPHALLERMEPADIASFISNEEQYFSQLVSILIEINEIGSVLEEMPSDKLTPFLTEMTDSQMDSLFQTAPIDDLVYLFPFIPEEKQDAILSRSSRREQIQRFLDYSKDQAGRIMRTPVFSLPAHTTAVDSIQHLRKRSEEESIFYIYCTNNDGELIGVVSVRQVATAPAHTILQDLMKKDVISVQPTMTTREVARTAAHYDFLSLPVTNEQGKLLGLITLDDIIDIIQDQNTANLYARVGLQRQETVHTSPWVSIKNRIPWMCLNLGLAIIASSVISLFEQTMSRLIVLASLKNIVASMGGNTAIQTLTVTTRGIATGEFRFTSFSQALLKELIVGLFMGVIMGIGTGFIVYFWKNDPLVSVVIAIAMVLNFLMAVVMGAIVPILLTMFKRDPAVGSGVLVTMITDIFGFFTFLFIAQMGLRYFNLTF